MKSNETPLNHHRIPNFSWSRPKPLPGTTTWRLQLAASFGEGELLLGFEVEKKIGEYHGIPILSTNKNGGLTA